MSLQETVYILVGVFEASKLDREHLESNYHIAYPLPSQYSLVLTDVINQDLGDQIAETVSKRVDAAVKYIPIPELDREALGEQMISFSRDNIAVRLVDPSDKANIQSIISHNSRSFIILSRFTGNAAITAYKVIKLIGLLHSTASEGTMIEAVQDISELDPESVQYLVNDMSREECFRHVFRAHRGPIDVAVSDCNTPYATSASSSSFPANGYASSISSSQESRKRPRTIDQADSTQVSRSPSSRFQGSVKCSWTGCKRETSYTTKRGLSEHLRLVHDVSKYDAEVKAKAAFDILFQPPRNLVVPPSSYGRTQTTFRQVGSQTVQKDQLYGVAAWASSSPTIDSPASMVSMSPLLDDRLDDTSSPGSYTLTNDARANCSPSSGLEARTRDLLSDSLDTTHLSDRSDLTFDEATCSFVQTHPRSTDPWNSHNLSHCENEGESAFSNQVPVSGTSDNHNMSTNFTFRSGGQGTRF